VRSQRGERAPQAKVLSLDDQALRYKGRIRRKKTSIVQPNLFCEGKAEHQSSDNVIPVLGLKFVILAG
jgi:hypothetical protein